MTLDGGSGAGRKLSPEEAFAVLGNETRLGILLALGEADGPLAFSELYDEVDYDTTANFSYHLEKLEGHFVADTDEGYELRQTGRRVIEAVQSGTVTETPVVERTPIDTTCYLCEKSMEVDYRGEHVGVYCSDCPGTPGRSSDTPEWVPDSEIDLIGDATIPPAGIHERTPTEVLDAAEIWTVTEAQATARGVCPRCSATVEHSVEVCEDHDTSVERCGQCDREFGATIRTTCTNCIYAETSVFAKYLLANLDLMAFMIDHGVDPLSPNGFHVSALERSILSTDPFEARFTFTADGDELVLRVDEDLAVVDATRRRTIGQD